MNDQTQKFRIGLFVLGGVAVLAMLFFFGLSNLFTHRAKVQSFFSESVQGLTVGSAVKYRGVPIGTVTRIVIRVSDKLVQVDMEVDFDTFVNKVYLATYVCILVFIILSILLYKTRFGLRLRACGENPQAADSLGINVYKMRWAGVLISGVLGGIGGIVFITAGVSEWRFEYGVAGFGFLSLAVMIFGQWKPQRIALAALLFGFFRALGNVYTGFSFLKAMNLPSSLYNMLPYIISLIVLAFTSKNSRAPKAEGIPYDKGMR